MTPKERVIAALELRQPDDVVPTFELEFQLADEYLGKNFRGYNNLTEKELEAAVKYNAELYVEIAEKLDYSIIRTGDIRIIKELVNMGVDRTYLICGESDGTMGIPNGENMVEVSRRLFEEPDDVKRGLEQSATNAIESGKRQIDAGAECLTMCADYCFNSGPFLSPPMFAEFVDMGGRRFCKVLFTCVSEPDPTRRLLEALHEGGIDFTWTNYPNGST